MAQGIPGRLIPPIFLTFRHYNGGKSPAKRTGRLYPRRIPWYSLSEAESTSGHVVMSGEPRKKIHSDITGNRSWDRPTSSIVAVLYNISDNLQLLSIGRASSALVTVVTEILDIVLLVRLTKKTCDVSVARFVSVFRWGENWGQQPL